MCNESVNLFGIETNPIPPKSVSEHNAKSVRNGLIGENYAEIHYQTTVCQNALIDAEYNGRPLKVKTCQVWIHDACNAKRRRRGRFYLRQDQHRALISKNGLYAFVLLNKEGKVLFSKLVDASTISMGNRKIRQLPWSKIFDDFDYQPESNRGGIKEPNECNKTSTYNEDFSEVIPTRLPRPGDKTVRVPLWKALEIVEEFYKAQRKGI